MDDLVSRQAVIDWLKNEWNGMVTSLFDGIKALPSAQQDCADCPEYDHKTHSCPKYCEVIRRTLEEAKQKRTGRWIDYVEDGYVECPFCHSATNCDGNISELHFCFSCGARKEVWYEFD